jgi:hypothetical protein
VRGLLSADHDLGNPWIGLAAASGLAAVTISVAVLMLRERLRTL